MGDLPGHAQKSTGYRAAQVSIRRPCILGVIVDGRNNSLSADPAPHTFTILAGCKEIMKKGYRLYSCTDQRFVESVFKLVRREFQQKPVLTVEQFLRKGFAEHKIIFLLEHYEALS